MIRWIKDWWYRKTKKVYAVVFDGSPFSDEHFVEIEGWWAAVGFGKQWIHDHPHGSFRVIDGPLRKGTGCMYFTRPRIACSFIACGACSGISLY